MVLATASSKTGANFSSSHSTYAESRLAILLSLAFCVMASDKGIANNNAERIVAHTSPFMAPGMIPPNLLKWYW